MWVLGVGLTRRNEAWFKGKSTGNHGFYHQNPSNIGLFEVNFPKSSNSMIDGIDTLW
jgi:hypothetical protein